jgi:hypothetical protein
VNKEMFFHMLRCNCDVIISLISLFVLESAFFVAIHELHSGIHTVYSVYASFHIRLLGILAMSVNHLLRRTDPAMRSKSCT